MPSPERTMIRWTAITRVTTLLWWLPLTGLCAQVAAPGERTGPVAQQSRPGPSANGLPEVSPDGRSVAFISDRTGHNRAFVLDLGSPGDRQVTGRDAERVRWSPVDRELRISGGGADSGRVLALDLGTGLIRTAAQVAGRGPVLSPDGSRVAYIAGPWTSTTLLVANRDGSGARALAGGGGTTAWNPSWSPDGRHIAYTYGDSSHVLQVHVINDDGSADRAVTHTTATDGSAQIAEWSPDGTRLAFQVSTFRTKTAHVWIVDLATGVTRQLAPHADGVLDETPSWFPDGRHLAFQSTQGGTMEVWMMDADGTHLRCLTDTTR